MSFGKATAVLVLLLLGAILCRSCYLHGTESDPGSTESTEGSQTGTSSISFSETTAVTMTETSIAQETAETTVTSTETTTVTMTDTSTTTTTTTATTEVIGVESISLTFYEVQLYIGESKMPLVTMHPENATDKSELWSSSDENIATVNGYGKITARSPGSCVITVVSGNNPEVMAQVTVTVADPPVTEPPVTQTPTEPLQPAETLATDTVPTETKPPETQPPTVSSPTYIGGILIANKTYSLPKDYNPGLDPTCKSQFEKLRKAAAAEGLNIYLASGYRSYDYQSRIYNNYVNLYGQAKTDTLSARPGHSEHQTGLAIDVNTVNDSFGATKEAAWLAVHAHEFGFIIRYPKGKEHITGYKYEPWHIRYLGVDTATAVYQSGLTLEEYLGITSVYND